MKKWAIAMLISGLTAVTATAMAQVSDSAATTPMRPAKSAKSSVTAKSATKKTGHHQATQRHASSKNKQKSRRK